MKDNRTFGVPREATSNVVSANKFNFIPFKAEQPGPCYYGTSIHPYLELGSNITNYNKYSLRPRTQKNPIEIVDENPGPGSYEPTKPKVQVMSVYKQSKEAPHSVSLTRIPLKHVPGPQCYPVDNKFMSNQTTFVDSKKMTKRGNKFGTSSRLVFDASKEYTPGPGTYKAPSAFGHYVNRNAYANRNHVTLNLRSREI